MGQDITKQKKIEFYTQNCIPSFFREIAKKCPNSSALIYDGQHMSYKELDEKSDILAHWLIKRGIQKEDFVALCLDRSFEMIISIFGILKAGGAYVPIDVDYPEERLEFMLKDAQAKVVLTQKNLTPRIPKSNTTVLCLDEDWRKLEEEFVSVKSLDVEISTSQLAYMIYTSGSTGKPKGCMLTHENVIYQLEGQQAIAPTPIGKMILTCSISFDVSVLTIFWTLLQGAPLVLPKQGEEKDMSILSKLIEKEQVTHMLTLPSLYILLLDQAEPATLTSLRLINVSGEVCPTSLAQKHEQIIPNSQLYNLYGPTEATVNCTFFTLPKGFKNPKVPIGKPILNYEIFILNKELKEVKEGEVGEIFIGGSKSVVGRGYWNREKLSNERFIKNPFRKSRGGDTLYNTGDLARWMPDGNIEFLGRSDFQVKFRGFRIELGEIEVAIGNHIGVRETIVVMNSQHELGSQKLVAYVVPSSNYNLKITDLRSYLEDNLPGYMMPTNFVFLDKMPLTTNGKIDRKALPALGSDRPNLSQSFESPNTSLEKYLARIWSNLLDINSIGRKDKFFELGGTSIQAARFIGELQKRMKTSIFITTIFDNPTISEYAKMLETQYSKDIAALKIHKEENLNVKTQEDELKISNTLILPEGKITSDHITYFQKIIPKVELKKSNQKKNPKAVFILAPPRSGTTLLRVMLAGHPRLFAANELQLLGFNDLKERNEAYQGKFSLWSEGLIRVIMELKNCTAEAAKKQVINYVQKGWTTQRMFLEIQNSVDPQILVDKSPSYALDLKSLLKAEEDFQDAIFIQLVRHPYSMVKSFEKYHMDQVLHLDEHHFSSKQLGELVWLESHNNINKFFDSIPRHRKIQIQYEELVTQPAKVMWELCKKIGIPFHDDTLNPYADLDKKMTNGLYPDSRSMGDINFDKQSKINADKATEWKGVLNYSFLCEKTLALTASFGYEVYEKKGKSITQKDERLFKIKNLDPKSNEEVKSNDIAIIGMAVRVAGANTLEQFWENLMEGVDVSKELNVNDLKQENVNRAYCLDDPDKFDAAFFGIMPKEAEMMDPQHRVFLEVAYSALQNAGYNPKNYDGKIGVFGGVSRNAYFSNNIASNPERLKAAGDYMDMIGSEKSFSVSRVAYKLNLQGPAVNVQTACSSSGVAVHLGCQSILNGDSDIVLIGGGRIQPPMDNGYEYKEGGPLSPDGYIRAFDSNAKGMVQGHGMVMIAMKKLEKAIEDGDYIWSIIKGTAINNDGSDKIGFTAPSIKGQSEAILKAQEKAGVTADSISYIEAHGTGTILGDPIEIEGLTQAYRHSTNKNQFCAIGSVKTNIGHLDAGACVAGIIKTSLALKYKQIPPSLNFDQPNPQIDFQNSPFFVNNQLRDWKQHGNPRRAGVSSFGLGGTNAHVILEEAPSEYNKSNLNGSGGASEILLFSGKTEKASSELSNSTEVSCTFSKNASYTLAIGREHFQYRTAKIGSISNLKNGSKKPITVTGNSDKANHKIVFLFPGGGSQYLNMGYDLYESMPVFRNYVDDCIALLKKNQGVEIDHFLLGSKNDNTQNALALQSPSIALPTLFTIEYALGKMWMDIGIMPNEMMGHSMGEYTAACLSGVMSLKDALALVTIRGKLFEQLPKQGGMLSVPISEKEVGHFLENELSVAVVNKPDNCVVSGNLTSINKLQQKLENEGIEAKKIHISVAAHSKQVELILEPFQAFFENIKLNKPQIPYISNVTGSWVKEEEATSPEFWVKHLRQTVRFSDGLTTVFENPKKILLEIGPGQTLSTFAKTHPDKNSKQLILATLRHPKELQNDLTFLQKTIGKLWVSGKEVNWEKYFEGRNVGRIPMPTYPFERKRFWIEPSAHQHPLVDSQRPNNSVSEDLELIPETIENSNNSEILNMNTTETRVEILITEIKAILYELSGIGPEEMDVEATYLELGFDSLFLSQAVIQLNKKLNLNLSFRQMFEETPTILSLVEYADELLPKEMFQPAIKKEEVFYSSPTIEEEGVQGQIGDSPIEQIIRHQLQVMEQQLAIEVV